MGTFDPSGRVYLCHRSELCLLSYTQQLYAEQLIACCCCTTIQPEPWVVSVWTSVYTIDGLITSCTSHSAAPYVLASMLACKLISPCSITCHAVCLTSAQQLSRISSGGAMERRMSGQRRVSWSPFSPSWCSRIQQNEGHSCLIVLAILVCKAVVHHHVRSMKLASSGFPANVRLHFFRPLTDHLPLMANLPDISSFTLEAWLCTQEPCCCLDDCLCA